MKLLGELGYHDGYLYASPAISTPSKMHLNCVDAKSGKLMWTQKNYGKCALTLADGHLIITMHKGDVVLAACKSAEVRGKKRACPAGAKNRGPATVADKRLYFARSHEYLLLGYRRQITFPRVGTIARRAATK